MTLTRNLLNAGQHAAFLIGLYWLGANLIHGAWVLIRRRLWERRHARDASGLLPLAAPYTRGDGPVALLFIHGFADTPRVWARMAERLAATGAFTCRAMRLPGCAEPAREAARQSLSAWRRAVDAETDHLRAAHGRVWLVGHSMGGALALDAALRRPEAVDGLGLFAPLAAVSRKRSPLFAPDTWFRVARVALCLSPVFESCFSADAVAVDDPSFSYPRDRFIPFCVYGGLFELVRSNRSRATELERPVYAVLSERDSVVDTPAALRWLETCHATPKQVRVFGDTGHVLPLETNWRETTDELADFICPADARGPQVRKA